MRSRRGLLAGFAIVALAAGLVGKRFLDRSVAALAPPAMNVGEPFPNDPERIEVIEAAARRIRPLHTRMGSPKPGDWLDRNPESGQSFRTYLKSSPSRPTPQLTTLYLQTWGEFDATQLEVVERAGEFLGRFFGMPVRFLKPISLDRVPDSARPVHPRRGDRRLLAGYVLERLGSGPRPGDAAAVLALTTVDLTRSGGGTWAFGEASLFNRVAVCSLYRQGDAHEDFRLCLRRTLKTCVHEIGHTLSIPHCAAYECAMNGSNSREEADARPLWFCPEDESKVWLACGLEPAPRYARLARAAESMGLDAEARFWWRSRRALMDRSIAGPVQSLRR